MAGWAFANLLGAPQQPSVADPYGAKRTAAMAFGTDTSFNPGVWPELGGQMAAMLGNNNFNSSVWPEMGGQSQSAGWQNNAWQNNSGGWQSNNSSGWQSKNDWSKPEEPEPDIDVEARPHAHSFLPPLGSSGGFSASAVQAARQAAEVTVKGESPGMAVGPIMTFAELNGVLPAYVSSSLAQSGIVAPIAIQQHSLPFSMRGYDVIGIAKTGSGKTLAFLLPAIAHAEMQPPMPYGRYMPTAVILAPVRELVAQIAQEANKMLNYSGSPNHPKGIGCVALYGGGGKVRSEQQRELQKGFCQLVAGTPGRMVDFMQSGDLDLAQACFFVLDEADRMLDGGFGDQMNDIAEKIRPDRQTLFFSATWPAAVRKLGKDMCRAPPIRVSIGQQADEEGTGPSARKDITQEVIVFDGSRDEWQATDKAKTDKMNYSLRTWLANPMNKVLVFVNTKTLAYELAEQLQREGFNADYMTANRSQDQRSEIVRKFKTGEIKLVVTTDVMARGLDIPGITHVLVFDCYGGIDDYVHRIGRTARGVGGAKGHALVFYEFDPKYSEMAGALVELLKNADQHVPPQLQQIANEVACGIRKSVAYTQKKKQKKW